MASCLAWLAFAISGEVSAIQISGYGKYIITVIRDGANEAAERTGRKARALEIDPVYVDVAVRRWEQLTGKSATLSTGETFEEITEQRTVEVDLAQVEVVASLTGGNHVGAQ